MLEIALFALTVGLVQGDSAAPAGAPTTAAAPAAAFVPEDQTPTGRFLTATEVRPILDATRANWISVREYNGQDLVYLTPLEAWRCGLHAVHYGLNGAPATTPWEMEPCYVDEPQPNAIKAEGRVPYFAAALGSVEEITVQLTYDDGSIDTARLSRLGQVLD